MKPSDSICRFEGLEERNLLSTVSANLFLSASNAPICGGGAAWGCGCSLLNWTGPDLMVGNVGLTSPHVDLSIRAQTQRATVSANVRGNLSVTLPNTVSAGQRNVPVTIKFTPTSETMSGQLDAGLTMPMNLSLGYQNLPNGVGSGKIGNGLDLLAMWNKCVKAPIISPTLKLNTPSACVSPTMGKTVTNSVTTTVLSGVRMDALQLAGNQTARPAAVSRDAAISFGADVSITRTDSLQISELDGSVTIAGVNVSFAIGRAGSATVYVNIPSTAKNNVAASIGKFTLKNSFYTSFGITASSYVDVDSKVAFAGTAVPLRHYAMPPVAASFGSTIRSQLNFTTPTTASGSIRVV